VRIGVIGAGRVGTALAVLWSRAGHRVVAVSGGEATRARAAAYLPGVPVLEPDVVVAGSELVVLSVPDGAIEEVATIVAGAPLEDRWVLHCAGSVGLAPLAPVLAAGGRRLALHPFQTFPDVSHAIAELPGCTVAVTANDEDGYALGTSLANDLGGKPFRLAEEDRALYHAAAVFASNDVVVLAGIAARLLTDAGVPDPIASLAPLQRATVANIATLGPGSALTGPVVRGDAGTVAGNLDALETRASDTVAVYTALARAALDLAIASGRLDEAGSAAVREVLDRWR
jgi:predicted short-subunit dehydrogenase-like oxidoreductase (DUF2520 family)